MLGPLLLLALVTAAPDVDALRRELDEVASRIEQLKSQRRAGEPIEEGALERLLVRSQELAETIEQARPHALPPAPADIDPRCELADELREQAAALRDEAATLAAEAADLDAELARPLPPGAHRAAFTSDQGTVLDPATRIGALAERRAALEGQARALEAQASNLEAAAERLERSIELPERPPPPTP